MGPIPFQKWIRNGKHDSYLENLKKKKDLFYDILGFDYVGFSLERADEYDRTIWGAVSLSEWIDKYKVDV